MELEIEIYFYFLNIIVLYFEYFVSFCMLYIFLKIFVYLNFVIFI